jgi:anti-anti-sigma factor
VSAAEALDIRTEDDIVVASLRGEIDLANARAIGALVAGAVPNDAAGVVLDLTDVSYLDSSGVHLVFDLSERLVARQQQLALVVPEASRIRRVLDLVNVRAVLPVTLTAADGVDAVRAAAAAAAE